MQKNNLFKFYSLSLIEFTLLAILTGPGVSIAADYYVDKNTGSDGYTDAENSPQTPWQTFTNINNKTLQAGDRVYLRRGSTWSMETLRLTGQGEAANPIIIDAYGNPDDPLPVIDGSAPLGDAVTGPWVVHREAPDNIPGALIFKSNWESGDLLDSGSWVKYGSDNILSLSSSDDLDINDKYGVINGSKSLRVTKNGSETAYLETDVDTGVDGEFYLRFTFRHIGRQTSDDNSGFVIMKLLDAGGQSVFELGFNRNDTNVNAPSPTQQHLLYFNCWKCVNGTWTYPRGMGAQPTFDGRPHTIELHYKPGAGNGEARIIFDGRTDTGAVGLIENLNNYDVRVGKIRFGLMDGSSRDTDVTFSAAGKDTFWLDDVAVGASSAGWLKSPATIYKTNSPIVDTPASTPNKRFGQVWNVDSDAPLNAADGKRSTDIANYLLPGEYDISNTGEVYVATRSGGDPNATNYLITAKREGIYIRGSSHLIVRNVRVQYQWEDGILAGADQNTNLTVEDSEVRRTSRIGIKIETPATNVTLRNNKVWEITGLYNERSEGFGIHFGSSQHGGSRTPISNITISDNVVWDIGAWRDTNCCEYAPSIGYGIEVDLNSTGVLLERNNVSLIPGSRFWWETLRHGSMTGFHFETYNNDGSGTGYVGDDFLIRNNLLTNLPASLVMNKFNIAANIYNNTVAMPSSGFLAPRAFRMGSDKETVAPGDQIAISLRNNLVYSSPDLEADADKRTVFAVLDRDINNGAINSDYNLVFHPTFDFSATLYPIGAPWYPNAIELMPWLAWTNAVSGEGGGVGELYSLAPNADPTVIANRYGLAPESIAIDKGLDVGIPYDGAAPDMGHIEGEFIALADADMESTDTTDWFPLSVNLSKSSSTVRSGKKSLRVAGLAQNGGNRAEAAVLSVKTGEKYRLSAWAYASDITYMNGLAVRDITKNQYLVSPFSVGSHYLREGNKWVYLEAIFTVPLGTDSVGAWLMNRNLNSPTYFDDVQLTRIAPTTDADGDGYEVGPIPVGDCNDTDPLINPGVIETSPANDGIDQNCDGLDLSIIVTQAAFQGSWLNVTATSNLHSAANLSIRGHGDMQWSDNDQVWWKKIQFKGNEARPSTIIVDGIEGVVEANVAQ